MRIFYGIVDEDNKYVDERCISYDSILKKYCYKSYDSYKNMILIDNTYDQAVNTIAIIMDNCIKANIHKTFKVVTINI